MTAASEKRSHHEGETAFNPEDYIIPADLTLIHCVDERQHDEDETNGVEIPGGVYGMLDAIKSLTGVSEEEARAMVVAAGIAIGAHVDDHAGELGCGYAKLVEQSPEAVGAPEPVKVSDRLAWVEANNGQVLHYTGEHRPTHAVINYRDGVSLDPDKAWKNGFGVFNCDVWYAGYVADKLGIDRDAMMVHVAEMYRKTVTALTGITNFIDIH